MRQVVRLTDSSLSALAQLAHTTAMAGRHDDARALLRRTLERSRTEYVSPGAIADVYIGLGEGDEALTWLEKAFAERSNKIAYLADREHDPIRDHPRFQALLVGAGLK
jgi:hypothetical protein